LFLSRRRTWRFISASNVQVVERILFDFDAERVDGSVRLLATGGLSRGHDQEPHYR
jgi:hypothetical protein